MREYRLPWETGPALWRIFSPDGRAEAQALLPDDLVVHEIGEDYVLGMMRDEMDVEHIWQLRLRRSPDGGL